MHFIIEKGRGFGTEFFWKKQGVPLGKINKTITAKLLVKFYSNIKTTLSELV
jgi:hypothetical protein